MFFDPTLICLQQTRTTSPQLLITILDQVTWKVDVFSYQLRNLLACSYPPTALLRQVMNHMEVSTMHDGTDSSVVTSLDLVFKTFWTGRQTTEGTFRSSRQRSLDNWQVLHVLDLLHSYPAIPTHRGRLECLSSLTHEGDRTPGSSMTSEGTPKGTEGGIWKKIDPLNSSSPHLADILMRLLSENG